MALTKQVRKLKASGVDVVGLTLGEPDFDTPLHIRQAGIVAIEESFTHYPPVAGIPPLREAVAALYQNRHGLPAKAANVVVSTGAKQSLINLIMSLVDPGEEAILSAPYWVSYKEMLKMADAEIVTISTDIDSEYKMLPAQLEAKPQRKHPPDHLQQPQQSHWLHVQPGGVASAG